MKKSVLALALLMSFTMLTACGKKNEEKGLYSYKTEFVGDNSKVSGIASGIKYPEGYTEDGIKINSKEEPYSLDIYLNVKSSDENIDFFDQAVLTFALIGNVEQINYINKDNNELIDSYKRETVEVVLRENGEKSLKEIGSSQEEIDNYLKNTEN